MKNKFISFLLASAMVVSMVVPVQAADTFKDVPRTHWAYSAVEEMADRGIVSGVGNGKFNPNDYVTNAQFVSMLMRLFYGEELAKDQKSYSLWYEKAMQQAKDSGILYQLDLDRVWGYKGDVRSMRKNAADSPVFRMEMAVMAYKYLKEKAALPTEDTLRNITAAGIPDLGNDTTVFEQFAIASVYEMGCLSGTDKKGTFGGDLLMTRAQACVVLSAMLDVVEAYQGGRTGADWVKSVESGKVKQVLKAPTLTNGLERNEYNVASRVNELRKTYPHGMDCTDEAFFYIDPKTGRTTGNSGCYAFAMYVYDHVFGYDSLYDLEEKPLNENSFKELKAGDHIRIEDLPHSVIVLQAGDTELKVVEGNLGGKVSWESVYTKAELMSYREVTVQSAY